MLYAVLGASGALIGWLTNVIAIWLLFRPRRGIRLGPWRLQGLLPRRQAEIARNIGQVLEKELLSPDDLIERLQSPELKSALLATLSAAAAREVERRLPDFFPAALQGWLRERVDEVVRREGGKALDVLLADVMANLTKLRLGEIVERRLSAFPLDRLEALSWQVAGRELRYIEYAGGVLGLIIGLAQAALISSGWVH